MEDIAKQTMKKRRQRVCIVAMLDMLCIAIAFFLGLWIRYEFSLMAIPADMKYTYLTAAIAMNEFYPVQK